MSGGSLDYFYCQLHDHESDLGDRELNELVHDLADLFHVREWYLSSDTGVGDWNEARDEFKEKWFTEHKRQERIEKYLSEIGEEVRREFGISRMYCKNCVHWDAERKGGTHGRCTVQKMNCLYHRSEPCDCGKFEERVGNDTQD